MSNLKFKLSNLADTNLDCTDIQIQVGSTLTVPWEGYVLKVISVDSAAKECVVDILQYGNVVDTILMKIGDIWTLTNPDNPESKFDNKLMNVYEGREVSTAFFTGCFYTKQYSTLTMISDLPQSVVDGQSYTISGRLTQDRLDETLETPIPNEYVYITESGTKIVNTLTNSDGVFELTFTYHVGNSYDFYYPGRLDVNSITKMLNATTVPGSTHVMSITFNEELPNYAITAFNTISNPVESLIQKLNDNGTISDIAGWELKDIQINKKQLIVYLRDMNVLSLSTIKTLSASDVISKILASAVVGAILGMIVGAIFPPAEPFTFTAGLILGALVGIFSQWKVIITLLVSLPGYIIGSIFGTSDKKSTTGEVNENAKVFLNDKLKECSDAYNSSSKDSTACITYAECMKNTYANFQEYTQGYLFQKVSSSLTLNAKNLKSEIDTKCINKFKASEISCDDLITCTTNEGNSFISAGDSTIYNSYPEDDPYKPPWEEDDENGIFGNLLFYGGLALASYVGYKILTRPKHS